MAGQAAAVLMNSEFATTVAVAVPVILLALGAEARELDKRTRAQRDWPSSFNAKWYSEAEQALESFPDASPDWTAEQLRTQLVHYQQWRGQWVRDRGSFTSTEVVYGVTGTEVTELPEYGVSP